MALSNLRIPELNMVVIAGRLTRDPTCRTLANGTMVCNFHLASTKYYKKPDGQRQETTTFVGVVIWGGTAEYCQKTLKKGTPVVVEGALNSSSWEDKETGKKRTKVDIKASKVNLLEWPSKNPGGQDNSGSAASCPAENGLTPPEDEIPF